MKKIKYLIPILIMIMFASCSTIRDEHYFKDKVNTNSDLPSKSVSNYYRVKIRGYSFLSSSRYLSGYFDQNAINLYFNEISQPENAKLFSMTKKGKDSTVVTDETGKELVLVLSTNSKAFTNKIGGIVKNQTMLNSLAHIKQESKIEDANKIKNELSKAEEEIQRFILNADSYLEELSTKTDSDKKLAVIQFLNSLN
jgi:hypothetical protein